MAEFRKFLDENIVLFDGAMGTQIQKLNFDLSISPDELNVIKPDDIKNIHLAYLDAGADVITTNTFGANSYKCKGREYDAKTLIREGIKIAKTAIAEYKQNNDREVFVALDLGPIGALLKPSGSIEWEEAYEIYKEQIEIGVKEGVDILLFETQTDLLELRCGIICAKENSNLPILATMSYESSGRTFTGTDVVSMVTTLEDLGLDAIGFNCSFGTREMRPLISEILQETSLKVMVQPNAGLPTLNDKGLLKDTFEDDMNEFLEKGVEIVGGCCGTTPDDIKKLREKINGKKKINRTIKRKTRISSYAKTVEIGNITQIIGERINPTGKKLFQEELRNGKLDYVIREAVAQTKEGANILDVNVGTSGVDESEFLPKAIKEIQSILDIPLQIDSSSAEAIENAVRIYNGKPLINSVNAKEESLNKILPIAKKYGACVLGLTIDEKGIPETAEERLNIAKKILDRAIEIGIPKENVLIDCLALTISTNSQNAIITSEAIKKVKEELGLCTALGVSNVSFGLPNRLSINRAFLQKTLESGLDLPIINTAQSAMVETIDAHLVINGKDENAKSYISKYANVVESKKEQKSSTNITLYEAILSAMEEETLLLTKKLLKEKEALDIVEQDLIPALNEIGLKFEKGELFLPQLIQSSQTVKIAFDEVKKHLVKQGNESKSKGKILLATVEHDVHDIGKNIVKVVMENYGYDVLDMGKDVPPQKILDACIENNIRFVGLSALMTTTVASMEKTIKLLKEKLEDVYIVVGGAVLNSRYAKEINADAYAKHPSETANEAAKFFNK